MKALIAPALAAIIFGISLPVVAQVDHSTHSTPAAKPAANSSDAALADGLVKRIDKTKGTLTLVHGALPNGMPAMTMAYKVKDWGLLDKLQVGQKIRFATDQAGGGTTVTRIELVK